MAISATTGSAANNSGSVASLALPAFNLTAGQDVEVVVALGSTSSTVTSITDDAGNTYALKQAQNGTGVRTEIWQAQNVAARTSNVITVHVSPNTSIAAAAEEYAGTANTLYSSALSRAAWTATADSNYGGGYTPDKAINGNGTADFWASANSALPHYLSLDMASAQSFNFISILMRVSSNEQNPINVELYVSDDGTSWGSAVETVTGLSTGTGSGVTYYWDLSTTYTHRYFRIKITAVTSGNITSIAEVYAGMKLGSIPGQNAGSATGSNRYPYQGVAIQDGGGFAMVGIGFACQSGDTLTAQLGTSRQSSIPSATAVGAALYDNTMTGCGTPNIESLLSAAREWATVGMELRVAGGVAVSFKNYQGKMPPANETNVPTPVRMPSGGGGGILPPAGDGQIFPRAY